MPITKMVASGSVLLVIGQDADLYLNNGDMLR